MWKTPPPPLQLHLELPGFRFHPTEEELLDFYLARAVHGGKLDLDVIATLDVYKYDPWDLPRMAKIGEKEWYFFVPRGRTKNGRMRPNRTTKKGFWKATGSDRVVWSANGPRRQLGLKKTLVYYQGRAPCGCKTDWIMSEYRLPHTGTDTSLPKENIVLCKVYRKAITQKEQEQRASVPRESAAKAERSLVPPTTTISSPPINCDDPGTGSMPEMDGAAERDVEEAKTEGKVSSPPPPAPLPWEALPQLEIEVPRQSLRWALEEACLWSPLMELWSPCSSMLKLHGDGT